MAPNGELVGFVPSESRDARAVKAAIRRILYVGEIVDMRALEGVISVDEVRIAMQSSGSRMEVSKLLNERRDKLSAGTFEAIERAA